MFHAYVHNGNPGRKETNIVAKLLNLCPAKAGSMQELEFSENFPPPPPAHPSTLTKSASAHQKLT
jgi:hypothetical protein